VQRVESDLYKAQSSVFLDVCLPSQVATGSKAKEAVNVVAYQERLDSKPSWRVQRTLAG
jgi:hypothetical protein